MRRRGTSYTSQKAKKPKIGGLAKLVPPIIYISISATCASARVRVNDRDCGTLIMPPFRVVVDNLKPTGNTLETEVTNVAANHIRDLDRRGVTWKIFRDINLVDINYKPFDAANWPRTDGDRLGPVTLTPVKWQNNAAPCGSFRASRPKLEEI